MPALIFGLALFFDLVFAHPDISLLRNIRRDAEAGIPTNLPANWSSVGCFTDVSTSRTLAAKSTVDTANMTIENCINFCSPLDYHYAGVEFGQECYCDSAIQVPATQTNMSDCSMTCTGSKAETCGGPSRIEVFASSNPLPIIPQTTGQWAYLGCFTDMVQNRTLSTGINVPTGVTAATCTATCQTANFSLAGVENGQECWCANSISPTGQHVSDNDCRAVCLSDHSQYCGNADRIAVYTNTATGPPTQSQCTSTDISSFTLTAFYNVPPQSGPSSVPLKLVIVEMVPSATWTILSACSVCCSNYPTFSLSKSVFLPHSSLNPIEGMVSIAPGDGESPTFVAANPAFPGFQAYCAMTSVTPPLVGTSVLAFGGKSNAFSLCVNNTQAANGRLDVVFSPVTGHPHYSLADCSPVTIVINSA